VGLSVVEVLRGTYQVTQVLLRPATALKEGLSYELVIEGLSKAERPLQYFNNTTGNWEKIVLTVKGHAGETPQWKAFPSETKKTFVPMGCGPEKYVHYTIPAGTGNAVYVRALLKNRTSGKTAEQVVVLENGVFKIGHGMCSGNFDLDAASDYEISFALMDEEGKRSAFTKPVRLVPPASTALR
jgi:hypothetical protein